MSLSESYVLCSPVPLAVALAADPGGLDPVEDAPRLIPSHDSANLVGLVLISVRCKKSQVIIYNHLSPMPRSLRGPIPPRNAVCDLV